MWMVMSLVKRHKVDVTVSGELLTEADIDFKWTDGMVGVFPVFATYDEAFTYADDEEIIQKIRVIDER